MRDGESVRAILAAAWHGRAELEDLDPVERERRVERMAARALEGRDLWTGAPAAPRRSTAEVLLAAGLGGDRDLIDVARFLDQREEQRERAGLADEEEPDDAAGVLLRLLRGDAAG